MSESASAAGVFLVDHLQQLTEKLAATHTQEEVMAAALQPAMTALGALAGAILLLDQETQCLSRAAVRGGHAKTIWQDGPLSPETPAGDALLNREPLYFEHAGSLKTAYPHLEEQTGGIAAVATAVLPLILEEQLLGVLILDFKEPHTFTVEEQRFLQALAAQASVALDRARLIATLDAQVHQRTAKLQQQTAELEAVLESIPDALYVGDMSGITRANPAALHMLGFQTLKELNRHIHDLADQLENRDPVTLERIKPEQEAFALALQGTPHTYEVLSTHQQTGEPRLLRSAAAPILLDGQVIGAVAVNSDLTDRQEAREIRALNELLERRVNERTAELEARNRVLEGIEQLSARLDLRSDPDTLIRQTQELVLSLLPPGYAAYFEPIDGRWQVKVQTGDPGSAALQAAINAGFPVGQTPTLDIGAQTREPYFLDVYDHTTDIDPEVAGHLNAAACLPVIVNGMVAGIFNVPLFHATRWALAERTLLITAVHTLELTLERAEQTRQLKEEQAALQAFVRFTTTVASSTDLEVLAQAAVNAVREVIDGAFGGFYLVRGEAAYPVFLSDNLPVSLVALRREGVPLQVPALVDALQQQGTVFADLLLSQEYSYGYANALSTRFYFRTGRPYAMFATATSQHHWTEQERAVIESVGQGLGLALERLEAAEQVQQQRDEAASRARALEAFALLSRDLAEETDRYTLVRRAQEIMLSLLTPGYALYWEQAVDHWQLKSQVGDIGDPALQRLVDEQGLPLDAPALHSTWRTGVPNYQDHYAQGADTPAEMIRHVQAATAFRVEMQGQPVGMLAIGLFDQRTWTPLDKAMLETAIYSLGLLLERARSMEALEHSNQSLQAANEELEAFTYSASHDLRTPVRHVMGFAELAEKALAKGQSEKVGQSLEVVKQGALRMTSLIDGMLVLSRSGRQELHLQPVDLNLLVTQARRDVAAEFGSHPVRWQLGELPTVQGDHSLLQQVMTNLLSNAVKYSAKRDVSEVEVWCEDRASEWCISVKDNGVGFDPNYAQKLFGIFQRLHTEKDFKGTGVGLATMRRIVQKHGGRVFAESDGRTGATFGFTLPKQH